VETFAKIFLRFSSGLLFNLIVDYSEKDKLLSFNLVSIYGFSKKKVNVLCIFCFIVKKLYYSLYR